MMLRLFLSLDLAISSTNNSPAELLFIGNGSLKALVNEDTLLRAHCRPWYFLGCANWETFVVDTKCFWTKSETFLCPGHKICVRNKCCPRWQTGKHLCRQQCVHHNVSSFARALIIKKITRRDVFGQLPTGYGKRLTFQLLPGVLSCLKA